MGIERMEKKQDNTNKPYVNINGEEWIDLA